MRSQNSGCQPSRLGAKHLRLLAQQFGLDEWAWPNTLNVTGKWYLIAKPEHLKETPFVPFEKPSGLCPFCGSILKEGEHVGPMSPMICYACERVGWIYCPFSDATLNWDAYVEQAKTCGIDDQARRWDELGIPFDIG